MKYSQHQKENWRKQLIIFLGIILVVSNLLGNNEDVKYKPLLLIDSTRLTENSRALLLKEIIKLSSKETDEVLIVENEDTLYSIVNRKYRFYDRSYRMSSDVMTEAIKEYNDLENVNSIYAGATIKLPALPVRPYGRGAEIDKGQLIDLKSGEVNLIDLKKPYLKEPPKVIQNKPLGLGKTWLIHDELKVLQKIIDVFPPDLSQQLSSSLYVGPTTHQEEVILPDLIDETADQEFSPISLKLEIKEKLAALDHSNAGKYYVLDFFKKENHDDCTHGEKVLDVIYQLLDDYGISDWKTNIMPYELDFFSNISHSKEVVDNFITQNYANPTIQGVLQGALAALIELADADHYQYNVPLLYLRSLFFDILDQNDSNIISCSFWIRNDTFDMLPVQFLPDSKTLLFSAVLNQSGFIEDNLYLQPLRKFWDIRHDYGVFLVGGQKNNNELFGLTSETGNGISCLDKGSGWGNENTCISPNEAGTSFATPALATKVYLAKAYWKENGIDISSKEAKIRVFLSGELFESAVDHYALPGIPQLDRLLFIEGFIGIDRNNECRQMNVERCVVEIKEEGSEFSHKYAVQPSFKIRGIQVLNESFFVFDSELMVWKKVEINSLYLKLIKNDGSFEELDFETFKTRFKGLICFLGD